MRMNVKAGKTVGNFTQVPNGILYDRRLSLKARGLMAVLLSLPPRWDLNIAGLVTKVGCDGKDSVRSAFAELLRYGYVVRPPRRRDERGCLLPVEYEIHVEPIPCDAPQAGLPYLDKPRMDNPPLCNTISTNTVINKTGEETGIQSSSNILGEVIGTASATEAVSGFPLSDYASSADEAMAQNLALVSGRYWRTLNPAITKGRSFSTVFGKQQRLAWTSAEYGYLKRIAEFCAQQWAEQDPRTATAALIRSAFRRQGKAHQFLKYWVEHNSSKVSLRPFLALGGGAQDPAKRLDVLLELAAGVTPELPGAPR